MSGKHEAGDEIERLRENAEQTRQELGATAEELVDKLDVPTRAKAAVRQRGVVAQRKADEALTKAKTVAGHAAEVARENADTVASTARQVGDQVRQQVDQLPEPVRERGLRVFQVLRQRPALVVVAVFAVLTVVRMAGRRGR